MTDILSDLEPKPKKTLPIALFVVKLVYGIVGLIILVGFNVAFRDPLFQENIKSVYWVQAIFAIDTLQLVWILLILFNNRAGLIAGLLSQSFIFGTHFITFFTQNSEAKMSGVSGFVILIVVLNTIIIVAGLQQKCWEYLRLRLDYRRIFLSMVVLFAAFGALFKLLTANL